ncbi:ABC transporter substrate-binding protein [Peptoniphilus catoniae]|uniref:ABC transporter substrate-binding protein n=1 Tax=Peptoniphilus catoniae TaxID=1660341 RepID=UPI0010FDC4D0|nr:ABC transporter substrate-binding protein [Peptoniphilus catoniae]
MKKIILLILAMSLLVVGCKKAEETADSKVNNTKETVQETNEGEKSSQEGKKIKVGIVQFAQHIALDRSREGFIEGLKDMGYEVEEETVNVNGDITLIGTAVKKLEGSGVDLIYAIATPAAQEARNSVENIPVIFNAVTDPVSANLVESNEHPGRNVTGVSDYFSIETQLENFLEIFPDCKKLGVLYSTGEANSEVQVKELEEVANKHGLELVKAGVANVNDVSLAMSSLVTKIDCYVGIQDNLASSATSIIAQRLKEAKIPSFAGESGPVENGLLLSDGIDYVKLGRSAAEIADEIIKGKSPADIPVVFSTDTKRIVNKTTADALGLDENSKVFEGAEEVN